MNPAPLKEPGSSHLVLIPPLRTEGYQPGSTFGKCRWMRREPIVVDRADALLGSPADQPTLGDEPPSRLSWFRHDKTSRHPPALVGQCGSAKHRRADGDEALESSLYGDAPYDLTFPPTGGKSASQLATSDLELEVIEHPVEPSDPIALAPPTSRLRDDLAITKTGDRPRLTLGLLDEARVQPGTCRS